MNTERRLTRSEIKRSAVLNAAREEFLRCGFREANMDVIAERAGVSKRTVYNHYPSKQDLFIDTAHGLIVQLKQATQVSYDPDRALDEQLREFAEAEIDFICSPDCVRIFRLFLVESHSTPGLVEAIMNQEALTENPLLLWMKAAVEDGVLKATDIDIASNELHSMLKGAFFWPAVVGEETIPTGEMRDQVINSAIDTFLARYAI